jgi:hypothetical protein
MRYKGPGFQDPVHERNDLSHQQQANAPSLSHLTV